MMIFLRIGFVLFAILLTVSCQSTPVTSSGRSELESTTSSQLSSSQLSSTAVPATTKTTTTSRSATSPEKIVVTATATVTASVVTTTKKSIAEPITTSTASTTGITATIDDEIKSEAPPKVLDATTSTSNTPIESDPIIIDTGSIAFSGVDDDSTNAPTDRFSVGIRSFTVEVSAATEKPTEIIPTKIDIDVNETVASSPKKVNDGDDEKATTTASTANTKFEVATTASSPTAVPTFEATKQENGLYRVKIAEIITDEFNTGMRDSDSDERTDSLSNHLPPMLLLNRYRQMLSKNGVNGGSSAQGKINIVDLYPSKIEDFDPIIRESNEKMIREKNLLTGNADLADEERNPFDDDNNQQENSIVGENTVNRPNAIETNIPTTKIEIELIDEPGTAKDDVKIIAGTDDDASDLIDDSDVHISSIDASIIGPDGEVERVTDFTSKLQENDGIISNIERSFLKIDDEVKDFISPNEPSTPPPTKVNRPMTPLGFIERRAKKFDPNVFKNQRFNLQNEFASTKFDDDNSIGGSSGGSGNGGRDNNGNGVEFSATKFYNSKELYNEMLHGVDGAENRVNIDDGVTDQIDAPKFNSQATNKPNGEKKQTSNDGTATATMKNVPKLMKPTINSTDATKVKSAETTVDTKKILFFNVNDSNRTSDSERKRMQADRRQIIVESKTQANGNKTQDAKQMSNMHVTIIHENATRPVKESVLASSTSVSSTTTTTTTTSSTTMSLSSSADSQQAYVRPQKLNHLRDRINALECDMQATLPEDATVWRGNETHELTLPTTVSAIFRFSKCSTIFSFVSFPTESSMDIISYDY